MSVEPQRSLRERYEQAKAEVVRLSSLPVGDERFLRAVARRDALLEVALIVKEEALR